MAVTVVCCYVFMLRVWILPEDTTVMKSLWSLWLLHLMLFDIVCMIFLNVSSGVRWCPVEARSPCCDAGSGRVAVIVVCWYVV